MLSFITSLYRSEQYLESYRGYIQTVSRELSARSIPHEFLLIANEPTSKEQVLLSKIERQVQGARVIRVPRESLYASWNRGVREARYDILTSWNVDDVRYADACIDGLSRLAHPEVGIVYFPFRYKRYVMVWKLPVLIKSVIIDPPPYDRMRFMREMHSGPFFMFKRSVFDTIGAFDESMRIAGDFDWCARAARMNIVFEKSPVVSGIFSNNGMTLSGSKDTRQHMENNKVLAHMV